MYFFQGKKRGETLAGDLKWELESKFDCPLSYMVKGCNYSWLVYSVRGDCCQISNEYASLLSDGRSEHPKVSKIQFIQPLTISAYCDEASSDTTATQAIMEKAWKIKQKNFEKDYLGNWNFVVGGTGFDKELPNPPKENNWKKLKLLYWSYFIKHNEKAF
jgi:hypothetical protein